MLEASQPLEDERKGTSPLSSHNASRCSTPSTSHLDGTPHFLFPHARRDPNTRPSSPDQDMAIRFLPDFNNDYGRYDSSEVLPFELVPDHPSIPSDHEQEQAHSVGEASPQSPAQPKPSLRKVAQLLRLEKYQSQRGHQVQAQLYHTEIAVARTSRLLCATRFIQRTLAECIRSEDKQSFGNLFGALRDAVSNTCQPLSISDTSRNEDGYPESFIDALPHPQRSALLEFVSKVRTDSTFLADRISSLSHKDLLALLPDRSTAKSSDSVFDSGARTTSRTSRHLGYVVDGQTDLLSTLDYPSPLETLIHSVRSLNSELSKDNTTKDVWATVCARLISERKPGSDKIVPAVIDVWAASSPWPGKQRLADWIAQTLDNGAFCLEQPSRQSFRVRIQGRQDADADEEARLEGFFARTVRSLLNLLADRSGASVISDGAVDFCHAISARLRQSASQREAFCKFVLTRWLLSSFVVDAITLPESHGLLTDRFISDIARHRILREVIVRTANAVSEVLHPWRLAKPVSADLACAVDAVAARFRADDTDISIPLFENNDRGDGHAVSSPSPRSIFFVSMSDVCTLVNAIYPQQRTSSLVSDTEVGRSGLLSSASSASGFSLFPTPGSSSTVLAYPPSWAQYAESPSTPDTNTSDRTERLPFDLDSGLSAVEREASSLRDTCSSLDDLIVSGRFPSGSHLATVCVNGSGRDLVTQSMKLKHTLIDTNDSSNGPPTGLSEEMLRSYRSCEDSLREILLDPDHNQDVDLEQRNPGAAIGPWLVRTLERRIQRVQGHNQHLLAHSQLGRLLVCEELISSPDGEELLTLMLAKLGDQTDRSIARTLACLEECNEQFKIVQPALEDQIGSLSDRGSVCDKLRDKMWYTADVRTSAAYDDVRSIASALKVMGKPKKPSKTRMTPPLRHWSGPKMSNNNLHLKTEAQILELMSASSIHGGPNKLSDDQAKALATWLEVHGVENLCKGEERLQKLCMEIRKAVEQLTAESSPLWSSFLFTCERPYSTAEQPSNAFWHLPKANRFDVLRLHTPSLPSRDAWSSTASSHPLSARSSRDYLETRSPTLTTRSSAPFWSPSMSEAMSPSSATSVGSYHPQFSSGRHTGGQGPSPGGRQELVTQLRRHTTSLLLSELTAIMFHDGSETDQAFWTGLGGGLAANHLHMLQRDGTEVKPELVGHRLMFDFEAAFAALTSQLSAACDPCTKLDVLSEIDSLLRVYHQDRAQRSTTTRMTSKHSSPDPERQTKLPISDSQISGFRRLFCTSRTRPAAVFRDLQYIAALVPSIAGEHSSRSMAFWHAATAITGLKKELSNIMVETADSIIAYHSTNRNHGRSPSIAQQQRDSATFPTASLTPPAEEVAKYSMADAAHLLQITAKEGDAVAQRELATLYLTNPELMDHIIAPLARPKEVFKEELESKWRKNQDPARCDPVTMCVAHHWMSLSAKGGDDLAKEYLKQREEMEKLP